MLKVHAVIREESDGIHVDAIWSGQPLDRPHSFGYSLGKGKRKLAERLKRAIDAGAVFHNAQVKTDINQKTYVSADAKVMGRYMNADLKRLGY